jgi:hypothetical protein
MSVGEPVVQNDPLIDEDTLPQALEDTLELGLKEGCVVVVEHAVPL